MEIGYSSGFLSTCLGETVVVREVTCSSVGQSECKCIAKFSHEWDDPTEDLFYLAGGSQEAEAAPSRTSSSVNHRGQSYRPEEDRLTGDFSVIGVSAAYLQMIEAATRVARTVATVLLLGESGVGKSALARDVHRRSARSEKPFVEVNCAAIPEGLLESELFGAERGAFTGASITRIGRFEEAEGGTLFLDEVGLLTSAAQGKLLRVLQSQEFERLGSSKTR
jgi:two-component system response regulator HydG